MSTFYTPGLEELKAAWVSWRSDRGPQGTIEEAGYAAEFDRTMDEFGNEQYEDGFDSGVTYTEALMREARQELTGDDPREF